MKMHTISADDLGKMDSRIRAAMINSFIGIKPAVLLGTANKHGQSNLSIINSLMHIGANPALIGVIFRPHTVERHSLENILETGCFTVNHVHCGIYKKAHQTSAKYSRAVSEFEATGLTSEYLQNFHAPFVSESRIKAGVEFCERLDILSNQTILIIGKIKHLHMSPELIKQDGYVDHEMAESTGCIGLDGYFSLKLIDRLPYAQPKQEY